MRTTHPQVRKFVKAHNLKLRQIADGAGMPLSRVHDVVNGFCSPRVVNALRLVAFFRQFDPEVTVERLWGEAPKRRSAA